MSTLKRKDAPGGNPPSKAAKIAKNDKSTKQKHSKPEGQDPAKPAPKSEAPSVTTSQPQQPIVKSLDDDEPMFVRGGGSVLTPLEYKKIQLQAKVDAEREDELDTTNTKKSQKKKRSSREDKKAAKKLTKILGEEETVKIESLNFKKLIKGSLVLGQVAEINPLGLVVALPNNLVGHVAITAVSDALTSKLQENQDNDDDESEDDIDLKDLFREGQYIRAAVISTSDEDVPGKGKRRIELSLRPSDTNSGLTSNDVVANTTVMASVVSVEDHGCVMDLGLEDSQLRGFLPVKEVDTDSSESKLVPGAVLLCTVTSKASNGKVAQLSASHKRLGNVKDIPHGATTINTFLPGTPVELIVSETTWGGLAGKVLGHLDATADVVHSGIGPDSVDAENKYAVGSKIKARVICTFPAAKDPKLGISLLPHILAMGIKSSSGKGSGKKPLEALPISSIIEKCTVQKVEPSMGLYTDVGLSGFRGFVHISRVKDGKVDALFETSGPFKVESTHRARVVGYNPIDGIFQLSLQESVLKQQYLRLEDVPVGAVVTGDVESVVVGAEGVSGLIVKLSEGVFGFVPRHHLSDVELTNPEKKFRVGLSVKARVLSVDPLERKLRLTLKKTLVNSDAPPIKSYDEVSVGMQVPGTIAKVVPKGAHIHFYGKLRGFLPLSEMSEAFIKDPTEHFRAAQVVNVHILEVDPEKERLIVSCKDPSAFGLEKQAALKSLNIGDIVSAKVMEKTEDATLEIVGSGLKATLQAGHLTDKSGAKSTSAFKRLRVGQIIPNLMVIDKNERRRAIVLTSKPSLIEAFKAGKLLTDLANAKVGSVLSGFVKEIGQTAVIIQFGGVAKAVLPKNRLGPDAQSKTHFGLEKYQSIEVKVVSLYLEQSRMIVASLDAVVETKEGRSKESSTLQDPSAGEIEFGTVTTAKITAVGVTQLNVKIGETLQGRVDMTQLFDSWADIKDPTKPLEPFSKNQELPARVLGIHDARNHRFLPISHRSGHPVLELTARQTDIDAEVLEPLSFEKIEVNSLHTVFVNNIAKGHVWVSLSPSIRGRISTFDLSDDVSKLNDIAANFPIGFAMQARVVAIDRANQRLDLSARSPSSTPTLTWDTIKPNTILPGRVTKVDERQIMVQLDEHLSAPVHLPDLADDFSEAKTLRYKKNDIIRVSVVSLDRENKRIRLSTRPSRVLNSASPVADREIIASSQLSSGDIVRGFVKGVSDVGLFVLLGGPVTAHVKIANLSDKFIKEWKAAYQVDQLVKGRVIAVEPGSGRIEMSLKASVVEKDYVPPKTLSDLREGQTLAGQVRKVEEYGAFIEIDGSANVRGLCHKSEMADEPVKDARKLYSEGDAVKVIVLQINLEKKRINFGLKPSYFEDDDDEEDEDMDNGDDDEDAESDGDVSMSEDGGAPLGETGGDGDDDVMAEDESDEDEDVDAESDEETNQGVSLKGSKTKHNWSADVFDDSDAEKEEDVLVTEIAKKKRRKEPEIQVDKTAQLDVNGPQTATDYERLLLGQPDSSALWIAYMALQMQVSELSKAREIAERAIKAINIREETEKLNVWIAYLNLEVAYGTKETVEELFKRACQYNDEQEVHERLASIYIQSGSHKEADALFKTMTKKFGAQDPGIWTNYSHFLHVTLNAPDRARALLPQALQSLSARQSLPLTAKFAALEFHSPNGEPERGRTFFEGLLATYPKKGDLWNQLLDLEMGMHGSTEDPSSIRDVFERRTKVKGLKPLAAQKWFERWATWEEKLDPKGRDKIMSRAAEWVSAYKARQEAKDAVMGDAE